MRQVTIAVVADGLDAAAAYARISDFARYPELTDAVLAVDLDPGQTDGSSIVSTWTVRFRKGLLCWTERDTLDPAAGTIAFTQMSGDFEVFEGTWRVSTSDGGALVEFTAGFDLGMPTLADILDPVAEAALRDNILLILRGLIGEVREVEQVTGRV